MTSDNDTVEVALKSPDPSPEAAFVRFTKKLYPQMDPGTAASICRSVDVVERDLVREVDAAMISKEYEKVDHAVNELVVLARFRTEVCARAAPFLVERR
jgi:hypothetical protein